MVIARVDYNAVKNMLNIHLQYEDHLHRHCKQFENDQTNLYLFLTILVCE